MKSNRIHANKTSFAIVAVLIAAVLLVAYRYHAAKVEHLRHARRPSQQDASSIVDGQMLHGNFENGVSAQGRQAVEAALKSSDQADSAETKAARAAARPGNGGIVLTQPVATTVEDTEPTLTWDTPSDNWTYRVHIEDRDSRQTAAVSGVLDEAMWRVPSPLLRGHTYLWRVDASAPQNHFDSPTYTSATGRFTVLSEEGEHEIQTARAGNPSHLLLGSLYTQYQMWPDAVLEYRKLVNAVPDSPEAIKLLRNAELHANAQLAAPASQ